MTMRSRVWLPGTLAAALLLSATGGAGAQAAAPPAPPTIVTDGQGDVTIAADHAVLQVSVLARDRSAAAAAAANAAKVQALRDTLRARGMNPDSLPTTSYSVQPEYDRDQGRQSLTSYLAHSAVAVTVRDLTKVGLVIDAALAAGANEVPSVTFGASDARQTAAQRDALTAAVHDARGAADAIAQAAGGHLGRLLRITTNGARPVGGPVMAMRAGVSTPITPSGVTVSAQVTAEWEFVAGR